MFNNLVECVNSKKDNKRWAYFAVTSTIWTLALAGSIVGGIFLYDAKLDEQLTLISMLVAPPPPPPPPPAGVSSPKPHVEQNMTSNVPTQNKLERIEPVEEIKTRPASRDLVKVADTGGMDVVGGVPGGTLGGVVGGSLGGVIGGETSNAEPPPPPKEEIKVAEPEIEKPKPSIVRRSEGVIRGNTITQVKPEYPAIARTANISGEVQVDITIGEDGTVVAARVLGGHQLLQKAALEAARRWKFNPTLLNGTPVKVQGVLTFRFTL